MRILIAAISCLVMVLWAAWGICWDSDFCSQPKQPDIPRENHDISFEIPCECAKPDTKDTLGIVRKGLCLRGSYRAGVPVVLVSREGVFCTKTAEPPADTDVFRSLDHLGMTYLVGSEAYLASENMALQPVVAILGAHFAAVRHWPPRKEPWFVAQCGPRGFFGKPEQPFWVPVNLLAWIDGSRYKGILPPRVLTLGGATLLCGDPEEYFLNNEPFSIPGEVKLYNLVFSVNDRVYLMRETTDCHIRSYCRNGFHIFDLSGKTPEMVY